MAESAEESNTDKRLLDIFREAWTGFDELETGAIPTNSKEFHDKVKAVMKIFEQATRIVSEVSMFSPNELIDEVATDSLQFMMLPYFLGKLSLKIQFEDRAEVYFKDYLQRCHGYELCEVDKKSETALEKPTGNGSNENELAELMRAATSRNAKIAEFRRKKELEEFIAKMRIAVLSSSVDEEVRREFFLKLLQKSIIDAREELQSLQMEKQMVEMHKMQLQTRTSGGEDVHDHHAHKHQGHTHMQLPQRKPLQPFIITRNAAQKAVFGMGYPSLPVMTVNEFYDQRVRDGVFPDEEKTAEMNRAQALAAAQDPEEKEEAEKAVVEQQIEDDDEENLARMRRMDEYRDVVRRGDGNRHNRS